MKVELEVEYELGQKVQFTCDKDGIIAVVTSYNISGKTINDVLYKCSYFKDGLPVVVDCDRWEIEPYVKDDKLGFQPDTCKCEKVPENPLTFSATPESVEALRDKDNNEA